MKKEADKFACGCGYQQLKAHPCFTPIRLFSAGSRIPQVKSQHRTIKNYGNRSPSEPIPRYKDDYLMDKQSTCHANSVNRPIFFLSIFTVNYIHAKEDQPHNIQCVPRHFDTQNSNTQLSH